MTPPKGWRTVRRSTGSETFITEVSTAKAFEVEEIATAAALHGMASGAFLRMAGLALARGTEPTVSVPLSAVSREALDEEVRRRAVVPAVLTNCDSCRHDYADERGRSLCRIVGGNMDVDDWRGVHYGVDGPKPGATGCPGWATKEDGA